MKLTRGKLYWSPKQVRVWTNGKFIDLGERTLESSRKVADEFDFVLVIQSSFPAGPGRMTRQGAVAR